MYIHRQIVLIQRFYVCEFTNLLKFTCNSKSIFMLLFWSLTDTHIHRAAEKLSCLVYMLLFEVAEKRCLLISVLILYTVFFTRYIYFHVSHNFVHFLLMIFLFKMPLKHTDELQLFFLNTRCYGMLYGENKC